MDFYCEPCKMYFKSKTNLERHKTTNRHKKQTTTSNTELYKCDCGKFYAHRPSFYRHKKECSSVTQMTIEASINQNETVIQMLQERLDKQDKELEKKDQEMEQLRKKVETLIEKTNGSTTNNNIQTLNNIETQNVIVVNSFGNENTEYLTDQNITGLIKNNGPVTCIPKIIERIHFDPHHPENHNIKVTNVKNNYAKIIKDNKWVTTNKKKAIDSMIETSYVLLEEKYQDNKDSISEFRQERFEDFQNKYTQEDKCTMKIIKDEVDLTLINGTEKIYKPAS